MTMHVCSVRLFPVVPNVLVNADKSRVLDFLVQTTTTQLTINSIVLVKVYTSCVSKEAVN